MKITQLEQISEIAATRSLGQAAKNLYISQPALSYSLKTLEDELGKPLFSRGRNGVELTDFGKEFLIYVRPILEQWELLRKISGSIDREPPEEFGVSSAYLPLPRDLLPELLRSGKTAISAFLCTSAPLRASYRILPAAARRSASSTRRGCLIGAIANSSARTD